MTEKFENSKEVFNLNIAAMVQAYVLKHHPDDYDMNTQAMALKIEALKKAHEALKKNIEERKQNQE